LVLFARSGWDAAWWEVAILGGVAILAERQPVRISANTEITASVLPILFGAVVFGPLEAMAIGAVALLGDCGRPLTRWILWTALRSLAGGLAGLAALPFLERGYSPALLVGATVVASVTEATVDITLGAVVVTLRRSGTWLEYLRSVRPVLFATVPLYTPVIVLLAYAYDRISVASSLLFFGPAFAAHRFYRLYQEEREAAHKLENANARLERANFSFATGLVATLDARDRYTAGHSAAVATYSRDIAERMGLSSYEQHLAHLCGLVHDIGKVGLPAALLEKSGPLNLEERRQMELHAVIGERILEKVDDYAEIATIVRHHHERVDGRGYPDGLVGDEIPILARIISVADAYNAMTSDRPYRDAMPSRVARLRLAQAVEAQFDTSVVAAFEAILAGASESYRLGDGPGFVLGKPEPEDIRENAA
jgi:putative nucleotidyltransferase with HDIG domain